MSEGWGWGTQQRLGTHEINLEKKSPTEAEAQLNHAQLVPLLGVLLIVQLLQRAGMNLPVAVHLPNTPGKFRTWEAFPGVLPLPLRIPLRKDEQSPFSSPPQRPSQKLPSKHG